MQSIQQIAGIGELTTSALVATLGHFGIFDSARRNEILSRKQQAAIG